MNTGQQSAYFSTRSEAEAAAKALRDNGVSSDAIDIHDASDAGSTASGAARSESFWDRVKDFFSGESSGSADDEHYRSNYGNGAIVTVYGDDANAYQLLQQYGGRVEGTNVRGGETDNRSMQLREERLSVDKQSVQEGEVRVHKDVVTEHQEVEVPVSRDEVYVERRPVGEGEYRSDAGEIGDGEDVRIPVMRDEVSVEKRPVVAEEIGIGKRRVQETQVVGADVRRERASIDTSGNVEPVRGDADDT